MMTLDKLQLGKDAVIEAVNCDEPALRQHILDMGLTPNTEVTLVKTAPMGDPIELRVRGYELTIRKADAAMITLKNIHDMHNYKKQQRPATIVKHPGVGEDKSYKPKKSGTEIPEGYPITFALAGNQNCGKQLYLIS